MIDMETVTSSKQSVNTKLRWAKRNQLLFLTLVGVAAGFAIGFGIRQVHPSDSVILWLGMPGNMFMRMLKASLLPLLISSIISGVSSLEPKSSGKVGVISLVYIVLSNIVGVVLALAVAFIIQPGIEQTVTIDSKKAGKTNLMTEDIFADLIRNLIPDNIVASSIQKSQTVYTKEYRTIVINDTVTGQVNATIEYLNRSVGISYGANILGIIIICAIFGIAAAQLGEDAKLFVEFFRSVFVIIMKILRWIVWFTPIGVASLISVSIASADRLEETFESLGYFVLTVTIGILAHMTLFIPLVYFIVMRKNPLTFMAAACKPMLTGFAPPSSAIAIPEMMITCNEKLSVDRSISGFVVPLAATLNRDGSCLFMTSAAVYICQVTGFSLTAGTIIMMIILTTVASLAIPAIPSASIVTLLIILSSLNIPPSNIGLIMAVEWFSDRIRTASNVMSSVLCAVVTNKICKMTNEEDFADNNDAEHQIRKQQDCFDTML